MKKQKKRKDYTNKEAITIILFYLFIYLLELFTFSNVLIDIINTRF